MCTARAGEADGFCGAVICSKDWLRLHKVAAWAAGQRWCCNCCGARYNTTMGMLTEIHVKDGSVYWVISEFLVEMRDVKWIEMEDKHKEARTLQEIFDMIETVKPFAGDGFLRPASPYECQGNPREGSFKQKSLTFHWRDPCRCGASSRRSPSPRLPEGWCGPAT